MLTKIDFPRETWLRTTPAELGWDLALIDEAVELARIQRSSALVIAVNGRIVVERYFEVKPRDPVAPFALMSFDPLADGEVVEDVASLQKSVIGVLALIAVENGRLGLEAPVSDYLGPGWSKASREKESAITVKHVMSMTSGLTIQSEYAAPAGTAWQYNTNVYSRMLGVLESCAGMEIAALTRSWLTDPLGMQQSEWRERSWVTGEHDANRLGFVTTAKDLTRLGLLVLNGGSWRNTRILSDITPLAVASQTLNPRYALLWWLNEEGPPGTEQAVKLLIPSARRGMLAARGALGRLLYVAREDGMTLVRLGDQPDESFEECLWSLLNRAIAPQ